MQQVARLAVVLLALSFASYAQAQQTYEVDPVHSNAVFRIKHANAGPFWGMFRAPAGSFVLNDADVSQSAFKIVISAENVYTGNDKRDAHLKSPDFFNARQYPTITFTSKSVKNKGDLLEVTGDLTMHGVTKPVKAVVERTGTGDFMGSKRAGVEATLLVKMSDFEIKGMPGALSDEVKVIVGLEGARK